MHFMALTFFPIQHTCMVLTSSSSRSHLCIAKDHVLGSKRKEDVEVLEHNLPIFCKHETEGTRQIKATHLLAHGVVLRRGVNYLKERVCVKPNTRYHCSSQPATTDPSHAPTQYLQISTKTTLPTKHIHNTAQQASFYPLQTCL